MNQKDLNVWIEKLITKSRLNLEDLCGSTSSVIVTIVGRDSNDDRFVGEYHPEQFLKIDAGHHVEGHLVMRTIYNGMLPTCNYVQHYTAEQIFECESAIQGYFNQIGTTLKHYWMIPVVEEDLELYELMNLEEVILPIAGGLPCPYEKADSLQVYRKESKPTWATQASTLGGYITKYGMAIKRFCDHESEWSQFVPLQKATQYSPRMLDGYIRVAVVTKL